MSLNFSAVETESHFGVRLRHPLTTQDSGADKLLVLLPGKGYTNDYPLLYTLRKIALQLGYDVLSVTYGFQVTGADLTAENMAYIQEDVDSAIQPVLRRGYRQVCFAGKSLGTPLAAELARRFSDKQVSLILLTPIGGATQGLGAIPTLAVIGTGDALYFPELVSDDSCIKWLVVEDVNHSLEFEGDWRASLSTLTDVMTACEAFL
jgi:acetyl esterase/lipase